MSKRDRKRCFLERAARARTGKRPRIEADRVPDTTLEQAAGPSSSLAAGTLIQAEHRVRAECSESELSGSDSDSPRSDEPFCGERMQAVVDDFMVSLPSVQRKTLAVLLMHSFKVRQNMKVIDAAVESGSITGFNERTVRQYHKEFIENKGQFPEMKQGRYKRMCLLNDDELRLEASMWVRASAYQKGEANMTASTFCQWVNDDLLPSHHLPPELPRSISLRTAMRWLHKLGFRPTSHKKGAYVDGHEREDVVAHRAEFLMKLKEL